MLVRCQLLKKERVETRQRRKHFRHRTVNRWNSLTEEVVSAPSLNSFKSRLDELWRGYSYIQNDCFPVRTHIGVRANIHLGGQTEFCPNGFSVQWGGGVVAEYFRDPYSVGGGGSSRNRNFPGSIFSGVAEFFPLTAVTDPKFVFSFR